MDASTQTDFSQLQCENNGDTTGSELHPVILRDDGTIGTTPSSNNSQLVPIVSGGYEFSIPTPPSDSTDEVSRGWFGRIYTTPVDKKYEFPLSISYSDVRFFFGSWNYDKKNQKPYFNWIVQFKKPTRVKQARALLGISVEIRGKGKCGYCTPARDFQTMYNKTVYHAEIIPETQPFIYGNQPKGKGKDIELEQMIEAAKSGTAKITDLMDLYPTTYVKHHAALDKILSYHDTKRQLEYPPTVLIYYGPPGTGKSYWANKEYPNAYHKISSPKWWEGYNGEEVVIFEDYNPSGQFAIPLEELLKILDMYAHRTEIKFGAKQLKAHTFIFTTNINPQNWFAGEAQQDAFRRRVTEVIYFKEKFRLRHPDDKPEMVSYKFI